MTSTSELEDIDVVILCGGAGTRLKSIVHDRPKCMAEINGGPFLDILVEYISGFGFRRFILCIGYMGDYIRRYFQKTKFLAEILFSEETRPLGTAGAVKNAEAMIKDKPFLVMNGDSFCKLDLCDFVIFHKDKRARALIALAKHTDDQGGYGMVALDENGLITSFNEKVLGLRKSVFINTGIYMLEKEILSEIPAGKNLSLEYHIFPQMIGRGLHGYKTESAFLDIGTPERYRQANRFFKSIPK